MTDPIDLKQLMTDALAQVKSAYAKAEDTDLAPQLMELRDTFSTLREAVIAVGDENAALADALKLKPALLRHKGVYWTRGDPDPWCPTCWEIDHRALHLNRSDLMAGRLCSCPRCQYSVSLDNVSPPKEWPSV